MYSINRNYRRLLVRYAKELIIKRDGCGQCSGSFNNFCKITSNWGFKYQCSSFLSEKEIKKDIFSNFQRQRKAYRLGLAPFCCGFFVLVHNKCTYVGYLTHVADVQKSHDIMDNDFSIKFMNIKSNENDCKSHPFFCEFKRIAIEVFKTFGIFWWDAKADNFGFINGRWVIIDWGMEGFYKFDNKYNIHLVPQWFKNEVGLV